MSGVSVTVDHIGTDVRVQFDDSTSNRSREIQAAHFVMDDERRPTEAVVIGRMLLGILPYKKPTNWWGRQNATPLKFDPNLSNAQVAFSVVFFLTSINAHRK